VYAAKYALVEMQRHGPVESWILDDTGFLKQGKLSPCVQRQYTGSAGKVTNCQVAVSLTLATAHAHLPVDMELYMPETWADDRPRRLEAKVPDDVVYRPKWTIAIEMIEAARAAGLPPGLVLADSDYGNKTAFRDKLDELGLQYAVAVQKTTKVRRVRGTGGREVGEIQSVEDLAFELDSKDIRTVSWREGTKTRMQGQFAVVRVEPIPKDGIPRRKQWLVIEWPSDSHLPTKYALATLPRNMSRKKIVRALKERWRTERAYEDLKGELGLDHYEGRSYGGWNHHVTMALYCYAFLVAEQARAFPPSGLGAWPARPNDPLRCAA
jgi:SRSO17 transposase